MIEPVKDVISSALGLDTQQLSFWQMGLRAAIIYVAALTMVRLGGDRHFIGKYTAMDVLLGVILGSTLSRAINGNAPYFKTLGVALVLVGMHWLFCLLTCRFERLDTLLKGRSRVLVRDGQTNLGSMRKSHISKKDLEESLRLAKITDLSQVELARIESSGEISIIPKNQPPEIVEVAVESGVQTVRIMLD